MTSIETLTDFLTSTNASFRIFDMGRRLSKLDIETFQKFEKNDIPYPYPLMRQAWLAVLIWNPKQRDQQQIWFLKFPLDEQGKLIFAARDDLLRRLAKTVGDQLLDTNSEDDSENDPLKDNPFSFTPDHQRMAAFHAQAGKLLKQSPSTFYDDIKQYLQPQHDKAQWQNLGVQGIADFCARLDEQDHSILLAKVLNELPAKPFTAFCQQLENIELPYQVLESIQKRLAKELDAVPVASTISAIVRTLAQSNNETAKSELINQILENPCSTDIELLASIGSRCWEVLSDEKICLRYLQRLAENNAGQASFSLMLQDLLYLPNMREPVLAALRNPERGESLPIAVGHFFK